MENDFSKKEYDIVLMDGEYMELYTRTPDDEPDIHRRAKKGMLQKMGLSEDDILKVVDSLELVTEHGGADGEFDDMPYTPCKLVKRISISPPTMSQVINGTPEEEKEQEVSQLMLEQYYGSHKKERARNEAFKRYKSHIGKKNIEVYDESTGQKKSMEVYGVLDYTGKTQDAHELRISGFDTKLEKLSRASQGDLSPYEVQLSRMTSHARSEMLEVYENLRQTDPELAEKVKGEIEQQLEDLNSDENRHKMIQALIDKDTEFIETNNYTYNSRQHIQESLKTLGKHGETSEKRAITNEHNKFEKLGLHAMNAMITVRNTIKAPIHKAVGTYVAAPIHRLFSGATVAKGKGPVSVKGFQITPIEDMIATSQKRSAGAFKNKPTHRYQSRKAYFIQQAKEEMARESTESDITKKNKLKNLYKLAIAPRIQAIVNYKEGNVAVLNAGAHDIVELSEKRQSAIDQHATYLRGAHRKIEMYEKDIDDLQTLLKYAKTPEQKVMMEKTITARRKGITKAEVRRNELERMEIDDVPVSAISLSESDKAVKSDMTKIVTGVKTASRVVAGYLISKYVYDEIPGKDQVVEEEIFHPASKEPDQVIMEPGMSEEGISQLSFNDLNDGLKTNLAHDTFGANSTTVNATVDELRGISFMYNGKHYSGADINAMSINPEYAGCVINQPLDGNSSIVSVTKEVLSDLEGKNFTDSEVAQLLASGEISGIQRCLSSSKAGIPTGWETRSDVVKELISSGTHEVIIPGKEIPAYIETVYKAVSSDAARVINAPAVAALTALGAGELSDLNDLMRYTKSQPGRIRNEIEYEKARIAREKAKREQGSQDAPTNPEGPEDKSVTPRPTKKIRKNIEVKSFQRNHKPKERRYTYEAPTQDFKGFSGTRRSDLGRNGKLGKAGYNENDFRGFSTEVMDVDESSVRREVAKTRKPIDDDFVI